MLLRVSEAAELAGVTRNRIYAAIQQGLLKPIDGVPYVCLRQEDVIAFMERPRSKGGRPRKEAPAASEP